MEELYKLKYIVTELAKEPFNYEFNVSSFADLPAKQLINVCAAFLLDEEIL